MKNLYLFIAAAFILFSGYCKAQSVQVNPDGTHTIIINNGSTSTQVNPDGTHTIIINNGSTSTQINPDGTHTQIINHGSSSTQINPNGTITNIVHNGTTSSTQFNPDGTITSIVHNGNISTPDGTISTTVNHGTISTQTNTGANVNPVQNKYNYNSMSFQESADANEEETSAGMKPTLTYPDKELTDEELIQMKRTVRTIGIVHVAVSLTMLGAFLIGSNMH